MSAEDAALDGANIATTQRDMEHILAIDRESADIARDCERGDEIAAGSEEPDGYVPHSFLDDEADIARDCERADEIAAESEEPDDYVPHSFLDAEEEAAVKRVRDALGPTADGRFNVHVATYERTRVDRAIIHCWPDDTWGALRARVEGVFPEAAAARWFCPELKLRADDTKPLADCFPEPRHGITICLERGPVERAPAPALPDPDPHPGRQILRCAAE
jgi:hypothetical protein